MATDAPGVQHAFRLGWRLAQVYREPPLTRQHSEEDPNPPAHLPGVSELSPYERGRLLIAQIDCDTSEFLKGGNSIGVELARVGKGGAELSGARNMILAHYTDLLVSLTGIDVHLGTALGLGRMLADTVLLVDAQKPGTLKAEFESFRLSNAYGFLDDLEQLLPDHSAEAVSGSLRTWEEWVVETQGVVEGDAHEAVTRASGSAPPHPCTPRTPSRGSRQRLPT